MRPRIWYLPNVWISGVVTLLSTEGDAEGYPAEARGVSEKSEVDGLRAAEAASGPPPVVGHRWAVALTVVGVAVWLGASVAAPRLAPVIAHLIEWVELQAGLLDVRGGEDS